MTQTVKSTCPYCGVGCGVVLTESEHGWTVTGDPEHPANYGRLCSKGSALMDTVDNTHRLTHPLVGGQQVSWDTAIDTVSDQLMTILQQDGPDAIAFYASGQLLTEDYYVANKLMKGFIGSANIDTNSRLCMSSAVAAYQRAFGSDTVPCDYNDIEQADMVVLTGSNLAWCHPVLFQRLRQEKQRRPELQIVVIDPRQTATSEMADLHLTIEAGTDALLFNGLLHELVKKDKTDNAFIDQHTEGFEHAIQALNSGAVALTHIAAQCGITEQQLQQFYTVFADTEKVVTLYSQGINQSSSGTDKANSIINCHLATGRLGQAGMGPFSITGQPNAMGGREVGGLSNQLAAHMALDNPQHREIVSQFWQAPRLAEQPGKKAVDMFDAVADGRIKAIWIMATNPMVSLPNTEKIRAALSACECVIVSDCAQQTDTLAYADIVLPALAWGEKAGTVTNSERRISRQRGFLPPLAEAKPDWWIISQVAQKMGFQQAFDYQTSRDIFKEHAALSGIENAGQRDFDIHPLAELSEAEYEGLSPIQWPVTEDGSSTRLFANKQFFTPNKKARFIAVTPRPPVQACSQDYPLTLNTGRVRDQWHTMTRTGKSARLNSHTMMPTIALHPEDAALYGITDGQLTEVMSQTGKVIVHAQYSEHQQKGTAFVPIHWNQQFASDANIGHVIKAIVDPVSGQPEFKQTPIKIEPYQTAWHGFILSREALTAKQLAAFDPQLHWVKIKSEHCWRYEIAGKTALDKAHWQTCWADMTEDTIAMNDESQHHFRQAFFDGDRLARVAMISTQDDLSDRTWLGQLFADSQIEDSDRLAVLMGRPSEGVIDVGEIVCACFSVGEKMIIDAIQDQGLESVEQVGHCLKAGTNCGSCIPELGALLTQCQAKQLKISA